MTEKFKFQGGMLVPEGKKIIEIEPNWFALIDDSEETSVEELNGYCYFCDFNKITTHKHHIIRKSDGGLNESANLIGLCPNHHMLIHKGAYYLIYGNGHFFLKSRTDEKDIILPHERQRKKLRECPTNSINNAENNGRILREDKDGKVNISLIKKVRLQVEGVNK